MSRFYERYGLSIVWFLTSVAGIAVLYWAAVELATWEVLPANISAPVAKLHKVVSAYGGQLVFYIETHIHWFGALATLGTFVFGLVTGITQARRQLPRRLVQFMQDELGPVYDNSEAIVAAVVRRSANVARRSQLFLKKPLIRALVALAGPYRPRRKASLDETVKEVDTYIEISEKRLQYLRDIRAHAQILRGAIQSFECIRRRCDTKTSTNIDRCAEADFSEAIENDTSKLAALELRGLLRQRLGNLTGALQDFVALHDQANKAFCTRGAARALRLQSEILLGQAGGTNTTLLRRARRNLNIADGLFKDGRTLGDEDWLELGENREAYGEVQAAMAAVAGTGAQQAERAFNDAIGYYERSRLGTTADKDRVKRKMGIGGSPTTSPTISPSAGRPQKQAETRPN
jgi:hypothetical protein